MAFLGWRGKKSIRDKVLFPIIPGPEKALAGVLQLLPVSSRG